MNKTDVKYAVVETLLNKDLGKEVDNFLRGDVELIGMQISRENDKKVAMIKYVDREEVIQRYINNGTEFKPFMYGNYYHTIEISVPQTKNLAAKMNEVLAENNDIEVMSEFYFQGNGTKNVIILYASRSEYEKNEADAQAAHQAEIEARAQALAQSAVKEPDMTAAEDVLEKYTDTAEIEDQPMMSLVEETEAPVEVAETAIEDNTVTIEDAKKKEEA